MKLTNLKITKVGNSYGVLLPKALIEKTDLIDVNSVYDIEMNPTGIIPKLTGMAFYEAKKKAQEEIETIIRQKGKITIKELILNTKKFNLGALSVKRYIDLLADLGFIEINKQQVIIKDIDKWNDATETTKLKNPADNPYTTAP